MNIALWIVQALLAVAFALTGFMKLTTPTEALVEAGMTYAAHVPAWMPKLAGAAELLAAIGLILPAALKIKPWLTPLAAAGLVVVMVLAMGLHASLGEWSALPVNLVLGGLAGFVAWGRFKARPIAIREPAAA